MTSRNLAVRLHVIGMNNGHDVLCAIYMHMGRFKGVDNFFDIGGGADVK